MDKQCPKPIALRTVVGVRIRGVSDIGLSSRTAHTAALSMVSAVSLQSVEGVSENSGEDGLGEGCMVGL
jgi:hypothetical protein